jgi:hypothetical protein
MTKRSHDTMMDVGNGNNGTGSADRQTSVPSLRSEFAADSSPNAKRRRLTCYERELEERDRAALAELIEEHSRPMTTIAESPRVLSSSSSSSSTHAETKQVGLEALCISQQQVITSFKETIKSCTDKMEKLRQTATCSICLSSEDQTRADLVFWPECMHPFCWTCLQEYLGRGCFRSKYKSHNFFSHEQTWVTVAKPCAVCRDKSKNLLDIDTVRTRIRIPDRVHMEFADTNVERDATTCPCVKPSTLVPSASSVGSTVDSKAAVESKASPAGGSNGGRPAAGLSVPQQPLVSQLAPARRYVPIRKWSNRAHMQHMVRDCDKRGFGECALCKQGIPLSATSSKTRGAIVMHLEKQCTARMTCAYADCPHSAQNAVRLARSNPDFRPLLMKDFREHMTTHAILEFCHLTQCRQSEIVPRKDWLPGAFQMLESIREVRGLNKGSGRDQRIYSMRLFSSEQFKLLPSPSSTAGVDMIPHTSDDDEDDDDDDDNDGVGGDDQEDDDDGGDIDEQRQVLESLAAAAAARPDAFAGIPVAAAVAAVVVAEAAYGSSSGNVSHQAIAGAAAGAQQAAQQPPLQSPFVAPAVVVRPSG